MASTAGSRTCAPHHGQARQHKEALANRGIGRFTTVDVSSHEAGPVQESRRSPCPLIAWRADAVQKALVAMALPVCARQRYRSWPLNGHDIGGQRTGAYGH
jgi:hypothetical protein